jgi:hypothetical protein
MSGDTLHHEIRWNVDFSSPATYLITVGHNI